jgi:hypothetical protein
VIAERSVEQVLAELEMCSHVSAVNLNPSSRDAGEDVGGKCPSGGVDRREDRHRDPEAKPGEERVLRSAQHFRQQLARGRPASAVLRDAEASLDAWRRAARPKNPEKGDPLFKLWLARSSLSAGELVSMFGVTRQYVSKVRIQYREAS